MQTGRRVVDPVVLVPKPTADDDTRKSVVRLLRHALDEAEAGNIITVIIIAENVSEEWMNWASETISLSKTIGRAVPEKRGQRVTLRLRHSITTRFATLALLWLAVGAILFMLKYW